MNREHTRLIECKGMTTTMTMRKEKLKSTHPTTKRDKNWRPDVTSPNAVKVTEDGVTFHSYLNRSRFMLTPEGTILAQKALGADITLVLDELPSYHVINVVLEGSLDSSYWWEYRSLTEHLRDVW
mmetsp:Transcript_58695/g.70003  ORF Transcript_58695/g.70003 Transcript_58695/m.70003 type:complete len:125 (+) Transcript_58695:230-604(+)